MDEQSKRWFRWIADHGVYLFWMVWGAGAGATLAVFSNAADIGGDVLRVYLGVLTTTMAGLFGVVSARSMDNRTDRRKIRRKLYSARTRVRDLVDELDRLHRTIEEIKGIKAVHPAGRNLTHEEASNALIRCNRIYMRASEVPDFEDLVETEMDADIELLCRSNFIHCRDLYDVGKLSDMDTAARQKKAAPIILHATPSGEPYSSGDALRSVITHIQRRLGSDS